MNQYLVDQIYDHHEWIRYISPRKLCYDYDVVEKYGLDDIIVCISKSGYKYSYDLSSNAFRFNTQKYLVINNSKIIYNMNIKL